MSFLPRLPSLVSGRDASHLEAFQALHMRLKKHLGNTRMSTIKIMQ